MTYTRKHINPAAVATITARIEKKHPNSYYLDVSDSNHCVLGYSIHALVETEDEKIFYATDSAGRLRVTRRDLLSPTYKAIRNEPLDSVVMVSGGVYNGQYICGGGHDGWYDTTTDVNAVKKMRHSYAVESRNRIAFNAQRCYGGKFEVVRIN